MIGTDEYGMNPLTELVSDLIMDENLTLMLDVHGADNEELARQLRETAPRAGIHRMQDEEMIEGRRLVFNIANGSTLMLTLIREDATP